MSDELLYSVADSVATITLNRPDKMNSITSAMREELTILLGKADADPAVRAVVLTGAGKAYCAGADVSGGQDTFDPQKRGWADTAEDFRDGGGLLTLAMYEMTTPIIAAVNGVAAGLGATMLAAMDIVVMADTAKIGFVFAKRGIVPEASATWFLTRKVGISKALEWCLTGRMIPAEEAVSSGFANVMVSRHTVVSAALDIAKGITENTAPVAVGMIRQMLWRFTGADHPMSAHRIDSRVNFELGQSADVKEGISAFLEKRSPEFPGRLPADAPSVFPWWTDPPFRVTNTEFQQTPELGA